MQKQKIYSSLQRSLLKVLKISFNSNQNQTLLTKSPLTVLNVEKKSLLRQSLVNTLYTKKRFGFNCKLFLSTFSSALGANQNKNLNETKFDCFFTVTASLHQCFHFSFSRRRVFYPSSVYISKIRIIRTARLWKGEVFSSFSRFRFFSYLKNNFDFLENRELVSKQKKNKKTVTVVFYYKKTYFNNLNKTYLNSTKGFYHLFCFFTYFIANKKKSINKSSFFEPLLFLDIIFYALIKIKKVFYKQNLTFSNLYHFNQLTPNKFRSLTVFSQKISVINKTNSHYFYLMRPLFSLTRLDTFYICETLQLPIYPDKSNLQVDFLRNRVRKQILPAIRILLNPQFDTLLCKFNHSE